MGSRSFLSLLIKSRVYLGVVGLIVIVFYFIYLGILRLGIISPLGVEASFSILSKIINYTFFLAITSVVLSVLAYILSKVLPPSFFEPVPKIEYALAIAKMFDPVEQDGMAKIMDQLEIYPGFPYYSRESDHPSLWPLRVAHDRQALFSQYKAFLDTYPISNTLAGLGDNTIQILGGNYISDERTQLELIAKLRALFNNQLGREPAALTEIIGAEAATAFITVEAQREQIRQQFPNRFAVLRIKNIGKRDAQNVTVEFDLFGALYDFAINDDPQQVHHAEYDRAKKRIMLDKVLPGYQVDVRFWYQYYSVDNRVFPDKSDFIIELTQGLIINNFVVSEGKAVANNKLIEDFSPYELLYVGSASKKDDYSSDLKQYFEKKSALSKEHFKQYDEEHPSFKDVSPEWLASSKRADESVNAVWISFTSKAGKSYKAIHVFRHPNGPYILLSSRSKDRDDFLNVEKEIEDAYQGIAENNINDRGDDICDVISVAHGFTQKGISEQIEVFFRNVFDNVIVEAVHF